MRSLARLLGPCIVIAFAACGHGEPFRAPDHGTETPFAPGIPVRLTFNPGIDRDASWLPDGSGIVYSADREDRADNDRCLVVLPSTGGRITRTWCNTALAADDSLNTFDAAAVSPERRAAFVRTSRVRPGSPPSYHELAVAHLDSVAIAPALMSIPFTVGGRFYGAIGYTHWLDAYTIAYRAGFAGTVCVAFDPVSGCATAFVESGMDLMEHGVAALDGPQAIPGTATASSVDAVPASDALYFTLLGDGRVFRRTRSTGATIAFYDFGPVIARDVQVRGGRLAAIVGGNVSVIDPTLNGPGTPPLQYDLGGVLVLVDLATLAQSQLSVANQLYRRPALSPDGRRLVAERGGDLWLFELP